MLKESTGSSCWRFCCTVFLHIVWFPVSVSLHLTVVTVTDLDVAAQTTLVINVKPTSFAALLLVTM